MPAVPLSSLRTGAAGVVAHVLPPQAPADELLVRRLAEIGFLPGEPLRVMARAPGAEPIAVRLGRSTFALRRFEAAFVQVESA
ncbi:FeoA family protein [Ramlibacter sp.]|uniref:FeoA family protein n=1 Tax=Ramlibacter sp. TaxID=1917967 RepID=UPI002C9FB681|nr:FeoA family protein [Ramlibacter sp.]HWI80753.1 FeoA family protein [Ramlibacter sp.]